MRTRPLLVFGLTAASLSILGACGQDDGRVVAATGGATQTSAQAVSDQVDGNHSLPDDCPVDNVESVVGEEAPLPTDIAEMARQSTYVVTGKATGRQVVTALTQPPEQPQPFAGMPQTQTFVVVDEVLRGKAPAEIVVTQAGRRCTVGVPRLLTPGGSYLLFLFEAPNGVVYQYGRSAILEINDGVATSYDPDAPPQSVTLEEARRMVAA